MFPKDFIVVISLLYTMFFNGIKAASFSNVYVQRNPFEYLRYGPPSVSLSSQKIAEISAASVNNIIPLESIQEVVSPCVAPCIIQGTPIAALPPQETASIITFKSPVANVPVVLENKEDAPGYQYSYAVYDEETGDQKSQSEQSDGSVVRGQYSLIEPNGARREVTYTADDIKGFNAIVRNILPLKRVNENGVNDNDKKEETPSCNEVKNEQLKEEPEKEDKGVNNDNNSETHKEPSIEETTKGTETTLQEDLMIREITTVQPEVSELITTELTPGSVNNDFISYSDIIECLQSKLRGKTTGNYHPVNLSPLSYILLPAFNTKPCEL